MFYNVHSSMIKYILGISLRDIECLISGAMQWLLVLYIKVQLCVLTHVSKRITFIYINILLLSLIYDNYISSIIVKEGQQYLIC